MKIMCNHCGEVIEAGLIPVTIHQYNCKAQKTEKINDTYSKVTHPFVSFTEIEDAEFEIVKPTDLPLK